MNNVHVWPEKTYTCLMKSLVIVGFRLGKKLQGVENVLNVSIHLYFNKSNSVTLCRKLIQGVFSPFLGPPSILTYTRTIRGARALRRTHSILQDFSSSEAYRVCPSQKTSIWPLKARSGLSHLLVTHFHTLNSALLYALAKKVVCSTSTTIS